MARKLSAEEIEQGKQAKFEKSMVTGVIGHENEDEMIEDEMEITGETVEKLMGQSSTPGDVNIDEDLID